MKKTGKIIGLPVIDLSTGNQVGRVWDMIINGEKGGADYFIIDDGMIILGAKVIASKDVQGIGEYALTIKKRDVMRDMAKVEQALELYRKNVRVKDTRVLTQKGRLVGGISDIYMDEDDFSIAALEFKGLDNSKDIKIISRKDVITFGENLTVVVEDLENVLEDNIVDNEESYMNDQPDLVKNEDIEGPQTTEEPDSMLYIDEDLKKSPADDLTAAPQKHNVKEGKRPKQVENEIPDEVSIPEVQEEETPEAVEDIELPPAQEEEIELQTEEIQNFDENVEPTSQIEEEIVNTEEERAQEETFEEGIAAPSYSYKPMPEEVPQQKQENKPKPASKPNTVKSSNLFEQKQKEFLIGRRITKTIKDTKGNQILTEGEIITEEAINMAKDAGKLIEIVMNNKQ